MSSNTSTIQTALHAAFRLGLTPEQADAIFGRPMGIPRTGVFGLYDLIGIDLMNDVAASLDSILPPGDPFHDVAGQPPLMKRMIDAGRVGNKGTRGGFYRQKDATSGETLDFDTFRYRKHDNSQPSLAAAAEAAGDFTLLLDQDDEIGRYAREVLSGPLCYAAGLIPAVNESLVAVDDAMQLGYNWIQGPFEMIDTIGVDRFVRMLEDEGREVPDIVRTAAGKSFYRVDAGELRYLQADGSYRPLSRGPGVIRFGEARRKLAPAIENEAASYFVMPDDIGLIEFHSKANTLDGNSMRLIEAATGHASLNCKALVVHNDAAHFSCGVNLEAVLDFILRDDFDGIDEFVMNRDRLLQTAMRAAMAMAENYAPASRESLAMPGREVFADMRAWLEHGTPLRNQVAGGSRSCGRIAARPADTPSRYGAAGNGYHARSGAKLPRRATERPTPSTMILFSNKSRPYHLGPFPLERLARDPGFFAREAGLPRKPRRDSRARAEGEFAAALEKYHRIFHSLREQEPAAAKAPVPEDLARRSIDIKGAGYFLNASQVAICELPDSCWLEGSSPRAHTHAVVVLVEHGRVPEEGSLARSWVADSIAEVAGFRAYEIAISIANHILAMGFAALAHDSRHGDVDLERLTVLAGLGYRAGDRVLNPWLAGRYAVCAVTTDYVLATDLPLAPRAARKAKDIAWWLGIGGCTPALERWRQNSRPTHMSKFAMETVDRVDRPTTLIIDDEVPRVPKRASFFDRAVHGDLGQKAQRERARFAFKHPLATAMVKQIRAMVPYQDGPLAGVRSSACADAGENTRALKSLSYLLGAELTGICEIPDYAWYSHVDNGVPVECHHRYAVVMLIDQEYDTMEGASGDDFISGAQSMRAYMRGAVIAGIMGELLRALGFSARAQTNADSEVQQLPLVLLAGLGELSRIGELVLNPFVGPRFKSVVLTTDLPLTPDKPVDFGLQSFCSNCLKCARECPCDAISFGDKVMFNGYEMWKPDVERCARYRLTNQRGLACGRCMKTCPLNKVVTWDGPIATQLASWLGINARWLKPLLVPIAVRLDDWLGHGVRNPAKKWWLDLEIVDGVCVKPQKGVNERDLDVHRHVDREHQKIAYYNANVMPPPNSHGIPVFPNRKEAIAAASRLETPDEALKRIRTGGARPAHYVPTAPLAESGITERADDVFNPYRTTGDRG